MTIPAPSAGDRATGSAGRTGVVLRDPLPWDQFQQVAETAEETGYECLFVPEIAAREAFSTLTGVARVTSSIGLGTGVVTVESRNPVTTAMAAATVQDLSGGRFILGIGAGMPTRPGASGLGHLDYVREYVRVVRDTLAGELVDAGELFGVSGFSLTLAEMVRPPPIWLGALGDRMVAMAAEITDGVILNWCTPGRVAEARRIVGRVASEKGRDPGAVTVAVYVRACLGVEEQVALRALREMTGQYAALPSYARQLERMGLGAEGAAAAKAFESGHLGDVPEELVRALTVMGGRSEAVARFGRYFEAGADLVLCYPVAALDPFSSLLGTVLAAAPSPALER